MNYISFLIISFILFFIALLGIFINKRNLLLILMSIELMLLSINLNLIISSSYIDDRMGQIFAIFILAVAAAESSIGLAILIVYYRVRGSIVTQEINELKG